MRRWEQTAQCVLVPLVRRTMPSHTVQSASQNGITPWPNSEMEMSSVCELKSTCGERHRRRRACTAAIRPSFRSRSRRTDSVTPTVDPCPVLSLLRISARISRTDQPT